MAATVMKMMVGTAAFVWTAAVGTLALAQVDPALLARWRSEQPAEQRKAARQLVPLGAPAAEVFIDSLRDASRERRLVAIAALGSMGDAAKPAIARLVALLAEEDEPLADEAAAALARLGEHSTDALLLATKSAHSRVRERALEALNPAGPARGRGELSEGRDSALRASIYYTDRGLGRRKEPAVAAFAAGLRDPDAGVRRRSLLLVAKERGALRQHHLAVAELLVDDSHDLRQSAANLLGQIGQPWQLLLLALHPNDPDARIKLLDLNLRLGVLPAERKAWWIDQIGPRLKDADPRKRHVAARILAGHVMNEEQIAALREQFVSGLAAADPMIREDSLTGLAILERQAPGAGTISAVWPRVNELTRDKDARARRVATEIVLARREPEIDVLRVIGERLRDADSQTRTIAFQATPAWGEKALPLLDEAAGDDDPEVRRLGLMFMPHAIAQTPAEGRGPWEAKFAARLEQAKQAEGGSWPIDVLRRTQSTPELEATFVKMARDDPDPTARGLAAYRVAAYGEKMRPLLREMLLGDDPAVYRAAASSLPPDELATPEMAAVLRRIVLDQRLSWEIRTHLLSFVLRDKARAKADLPRLVELFDDRDWVVRRQAIWDLEPLDASGELVLPRLMKAVAEEPLPHLRMDAAKRLIRFGPRAQKAGPALLALLRDPRVHDVQSLFGLKDVCDAMDAVGVEPGEAAAAIGDYLIAAGDASPHELFNALGKLDPELKETEVWTAIAVRAFALLCRKQSLAALVAKGKEQAAVEQIAAQLADPVPARRLVALDILAQQPSAIRAALPAIKEAADKDGHPVVKQAAALLVKQAGQ